MQQKRFRLPVRWPFLVILLVVIVGVWQHQAIHDWLRLYNYSPPAPVAELADEVKLTDQARRLFYVNHPELEDRDAFNQSCSSRGEHTIVLGCYHPVDRGIFIFHVTDDRLNGVDQVTAAHEMLHAAYDRLSPSERRRIDGLLQDFYDHKLTDERVKAIIAAYIKSEPKDVVNEMHSVFGTELPDLPPELETYYKRYFTDRATVVGYADKYQAEFTSRQQQVTDYDTQLGDMKKQIDANSSLLDIQEKQIAGLRAKLENDRSSGNITAYNAGVPAYNARIDDYNNLITATKSLITSYNQIVNDRNQLALQVTDLAHSIDSSFRPID